MEEFTKTSPTPENTTPFSPIRVLTETDEDEPKPDVDLSSPGSSCSEPVYERQPGFRCHAHDRKYVKTTLVNGKRVRQRPEGGKPEEGRALQKTRLWRKEPLPMKLRALPLSFWQEPNNTNCLSPGAVYPWLPPLPAMDRLEQPAGASTSTSTSTSTSSSEVVPRHHHVTSPVDTELLFSLFRGVETGSDQSQHRPVKARRGRPPKNAGSQVLIRALRDDDPYLAGVTSEGILPILTNRSGSRRPGEGRQVLAMVSLKDGKKTVSLPSLEVQHNYSKILSDLVINL